MVENNPKISPIALIMAGGSGTRFWPASQKNLPKQYLKLTGEKTLIEATVERVLPLCRKEDVFISSSLDQESLLKRFLPNIENRILEPVPKNTAACLMLSVAELLKKGYSPRTPLMVFPADHAIGNEHEFQTVLKQALSFCVTKPSLITLGIAPTFPHTGYGYIESGNSSENLSVFSVKRFTEKPNRETAEIFLNKGGYFWNSGIFIWTLEAISQAFDLYLSESWRRIQSSKSAEDLSLVFKNLPSVPIDTAVLEKASNVYVIPAKNLDWSDLGSWSALFDFKAQTANENVFLSGIVKALESEGCLVQVSPKNKVALIGLKNVIVIEHEGQILIADKSLDQKVKDISQQFEG